MGLAFIACRRGTEGGSHPRLELSAPWSIRIAKRGSGGELQTSGFWCWCFQAAAKASATVTKMLYPMSCDGLKGLSHDKSESPKTLLHYHEFLCVGCSILCLKWEQGQGADPALCFPSLLVCA